MLTTIQELLSGLNIVDFFNQIEILDLLVSNYTKDIYIELSKALVTVEKQIETIRLFLLTDVLFYKIQVSI